MVTLADQQATVTLRALSVGDLRRNALRECARALGPGSWQLTDEAITPCLVSLGGRVRLYEGRFVASRG
jgi:hypothetical protein